MKRKALLAGVLALATSAAFAQQGPVPKGVPPLSHVWVIMMENHGFVQVLNNPAAPFTTQYAAAANLGTNYFAVAHPSLTNYLEINGGSNFGVLDDNSPDWHDASCQPNIASGMTNYEANSNPICPISGSGIDAATPAIDYTNEAPATPPSTLMASSRMRPIPISSVSASPISWSQPERPGRLIRKACRSEAPTISTTATATLPTSPTSPCSTLSGRRQLQLRSDRSALRGEAQSVRLFPIHAGRY